MKEFIKGKAVTALVVTATIILAGVAIFTAIRLYQLRREPVSPNAPGSQPAAWDCSNYTFSVDASGVVKVTNNSTRDESSQQAKVYINDNLVATLDVPALPKGQSATLGTVQVPSGEFSWRVVGTKDCQSSGTVSATPEACKELKFSLTQVTPTNTPTTTPTNTVTPTNTPSPTLPPGTTPTNTPSPTERPIGGTSPTPTSTPTATSAPTSTPTQGGGIAAASPSPTGGGTLPDAGISIPTLIGLSAGVLLILGALLLAL